MDVHQNARLMLHCRGLLLARARRSGCVLRWLV